jgi:hypothetical protein
MNNELGHLYVNPNGELCSKVILFGKHLFDILRVEPRFDGYDVNGNIINENDWAWIAHKTL